MDFRNVVIDVKNTFGGLTFKKIVTKTFKYENGERTDIFTGFKILVESAAKKDVFEIKVVNSDVEMYKKLATNQDDLYNTPISFDELIFNANLFKGKLYHNFTTYSFEVFNHD